MIPIEPTSNVWLVSRGGGGIANRAMHLRIAANTFRVTDPWARRNIIDPFRYLADVHWRLPTTPPERLTELLPEVWFRTHWQVARRLDG